MITKQQKKIEPLQKLVIKFNELFNQETSFNDMIDTFVKSHALVTHAILFSVEIDFPYS